MNKTPVSALIYDLDGTLIDSRRDLCAATNAMLSHFGHPPKTEKELITYIGMGITNLILKALGGDETLCAEGYEIILSYYQQHLTDHTTLYEDVTKILKHFKHKKQFVLTNKLDKESKMIVKHLGIAHYFGDIIGDRGDNHLKPDPSNLINLLNEHHIVPSEAVMIGDSATDIETGYRANIMTVFIKNRIGTIGSIQPDIIIEHFKELQKYFF